MFLTDAIFPLRLNDEEQREDDALMDDEDSESENLDDTTSTVDESDLSMEEEFDEASSSGQNRHLFPFNLKTFLARSHKHSLHESEDYISNELKLLLFH